MNNSTALDPLSTIIKLAILGTKPVGTKICIYKNRIVFNEVNATQPILRFMNRSNKYDLHLLSTAIENACSEFLCDAYETTITITQLRAGYNNTNMPRKSLTPKQLLPGIFKGAIRGLEQLKKTYEDSPIIVICLQYYINLIFQNMNYESKSIPTNTHPIINKLNTRWTGQKIQQVIEKYSCVDAASELELFMKDIDTETRQICKSLNK